MEVISTRLSSNIQLNEVSSCEMQYDYSAQCWEREREKAWIVQQAGFLTHISASWARVLEQPKPTSSGDEPNVFHEAFGVDITWRII